MRDNGRDRSGGFQPPISAARLINDDSICATMEILRNDGPGTESQFKGS